MPRNSEGGRILHRASYISFRVCGEEHPSTIYTTQPGWTAEEAYYPRGPGRRADPPPRSTKTIKRKGISRQLSRELLIFFIPSVTRYFIYNKTNNLIPTTTYKIIGKVTKIYKPKTKLILKFVFFFFNRVGRVQLKLKKSW